MQRTSLEERAAQIAAKLAARVQMPPLELLRNSGLRRTPVKRALLERIEEVRRKQDTPRE